MSVERELARKRGDRNLRLAAILLCVLMTASFARILYEENRQSGACIGRNFREAGLSVSVNQATGPGPDPFEVLPGVAIAALDLTGVVIPSYGPNGKLVTFVTAERMVFVRGSGKMSMTKPKVRYIGEQNTTYIEGDHGEAELEESPFDLKILRIWGNTKVTVKENDDV